MRNGSALSLPHLPTCQTSLFFPPFPNEEKMRKGRLNAEAPLGLLGEMHEVGRGKVALFAFVDSDVVSAPSVSPKGDRQQMNIGQAPGMNPYRPNRSPQQAFFDLDLDLNPDL
jgi:mediator of RNA polymerase II transcription subunit 4